MGFIPGVQVMKEEVEALHHAYNMAGKRYREKNEADGDLKKVWIAAKAAWVAAVEAQAPPAITC